MRQVARLLLGQLGASSQSQRFGLSKHKRRPPAADNKSGKVPRAIQRQLARADILILDEFGYVPVDRDGARLLFQVVSEGYERQSVVITTNLEFSRWGQTFGDDQMAAAVIDRKCEASHFLSNAKFHIMRSWADGTSL